jgi:hypothetical protein
VNLNVIDSRDTLDQSHSQSLKEDMKTKGEGFGNSEIFNIHYLLSLSKTMNPYFDEIY